MHRLGLLLSLGFVLAAGCNTSQEGAEGHILFTPDECGRIGGCDFEDSIGVGGAIHVNISGIDGFSTAGVTLESNDTAVLDVTAIGDVGGRPTWEVIGTGAGVARIVAYDASDVEVDFLEVGVQELSGLILENFIGDAVGPTSDPDFDEIWSVNADQNTSFYVVPVIGSAGVPTMGVYEYIAVVDSIMNANLLAGADLGAGYLYFNVPANDYAVHFENAYDATVAIDVLISAVAAE